VLVKEELGINSEDLKSSPVESAFGLLFIGAAITLFTGKNAWHSGLRQVLFGLAAAAVTFTIGKLISVAVS
jgi:VIT1/CCC1 family predicted Fe2+/Mn2+ transporter